MIISQNQVFELKNIYKISMSYVNNLNIPDIMQIVCPRDLAVFQSESWSSTSNDFMNLFHSSNWFSDKMMKDKNNANAK